MIHPAPPTYEFPAIEILEPGYAHQTIRLAPGMTDEGEGWIVEKGHQHVALLMAQAAQGDLSVETTFQRYIREGSAADDAARDWRRRWSANLAENPAIQLALEVSPDELYRSAGLSIAEQVAMQAWTQLNDDGEPRSTREVARQLKEPESTIRTRLERAVTRLREMRHAAAVA